MTRAPSALSSGTGFPAKVLRMRAALILFPLLLSACADEPDSAQVDPVAGDDAAQLSLVAEGEGVFQTCMACHRIEEGAGHLIGPNLHGVIGRRAGSLADFTYSEAMAGAGITWTKDKLDDYLAAPTQMVPGTTMMAGAVPDEGKRGAVIAYLESASR